MKIAEATTNVLLVIEDDPDVQLLVETIFSMDSRFQMAQVAESAEDALAAAQTLAARTLKEGGVIVLDHGLAGKLTGLEVAPRLKEMIPKSTIILFTAHAELQTRAEEEPSIDAFLLKTDSRELLPIAQRLTGLS